MKRNLVSLMLALAFFFSFTGNSFAASSSVSISPGEGLKRSAYVTVGSKEKLLLSVKVSSNKNGDFNWSVFNSSGKEVKWGFGGYNGTVTSSPGKYRIELKCLEFRNCSATARLSTIHRDAN